jgi:hypothetical protein
MIDSPEILFKASFYAATSFHEAALRCLHPELGHSLEIFPMLVNFALATEII